jgi:hypothetical protein
MEELYRYKGGSEKDFNCVNLLLTIKDIEDLEESVQNGGLPPTCGFFFGEDSGSPEEVSRDMAFINAAKALLQEGHMVYYSSWW